MSMIRHTTVLCVTLVGLLLSTASMRADEDAQEELVVGFTAAHFAAINCADAVAAMKVWIETMIEARGLKLKARIVVYDNVERLVASLGTGSPDMTILLTPEYMRIQQRKLLDLEYVSVRGQEIGETYLLLVDRDREFRSLAHLRGCNVVVKLGSRMSLAEVWLNRVLCDAGLPAADSLCGAVTREKCVSRTVLPVFFGSADACLVNRNSFETMCELNPQLRRRLVLLATSPCLVPSVTCLRRGYESKCRPDIVEALGELHEESKGQQILSLFRVDQLVPVESRHLVSASDLLGVDVFKATGEKP